MSASATASATAFKPPRNSRVAGVVAVAASGGVVAWAATATGSKISLPFLAAIGCILAIISGAAALWAPHFPLWAALGYAAGPVSFYITFRHTDSAHPYPDASDLALDSVIPLALAFGYVGTWLAHRELRHRLRREPLSLPLAALLSVWLIAAMIGILRGNPGRLVLTDLVPVFEIALFYALTYALVREPRQLRSLIAFLVGGLALTATIRIAFLPLGSHGFGVTEQAVGSHVLPRVFQVYPFGWCLLLLIAYLAASTDIARNRRGAFVVVVIFTVCVLFSWERGVWAFILVGSVPAGLTVLRRFPKQCALVGGGFAVVAVALSFAGFGSRSPFTLLYDRLAYTRQQVFESKEPIQNKRRDEAKAIIKAIKRHRAGWLAGQGLGARYLGPVGFRDVTYATSFRPKHYSFNTYLAIALRTGALGLAALIVLIGALFRLLFRIGRQAASDLVRLEGWTLLAATFGLMLTSFADPYLLAHPLAIYQGLTFALFVRMAAWPPEQVDPRTKA